MMTIGLGSFNLMVLGILSGKAAGKRERALEIDVGNHSRSLGLL